MQSAMEPQVLSPPTQQRPVSPQQQLSPGPPYEANWTAAEPAQPESMELPAQHPPRHQPPHQHHWAPAQAAQEQNQLTLKLPALTQHRPVPPVAATQAQTQNQQAAMADQLQHQLPENTRSAQNRLAEQDAAHEAEPDALSQQTSPPEQQPAPTAST